MKYKVLKSIAHNLSHSFVSYTNYFDDGYVVDDLLLLARSAKKSYYWKFSMNAVAFQKSDSFSSNLSRAAGSF